MTHTEVPLGLAIAHTAAFLKWKAKVKKQHANNGNKKEAERKNQKAAKQQAAHKPHEGSLHEWNAARSGALAAEQESHAKHYENKAKNAKGRKKDKYTAYAKMHRDHHENLDGLHKHFTQLAKQEKLDDEKFRQKEEAKAAHHAAPRHHEAPGHHAAPRHHEAPTHHAAPSHHEAPTQHAAPTRSMQFKQYADKYSKLEKEARDQGLHDLADEHKRTAEKHEAAHKFYAK